MARTDLPTRPAATLPPQRRPGIAATPPGPPQPLIALIGAPVVLHLRYGELMRGTLIKMFTYEVIVRIRAGVECVVMKHAIDWVEPAAASSLDPVEAARP
jgi:sRNA-binding regulator protein Hfq